MVLLKEDSNLRNQLRTEHHLMMHTPAERGDAMVLDTMLESGFDPNAKDSNGVTALHRAAMAGRVDAVRALLAKGASIDALDGMFAATPLVWACEGWRHGPRVGADHVDVARLLLAAEIVYGGEEKVSFRRRGDPFPQAAVEDRDVNWLTFYALAHYDFTKWFGLTFRYGFFDDYQGSRTGVAQVLQSFTLTPMVHLSRLIPDLRPLGVTYARTRHPLDWVDVRLEYRFDKSNQPVFSNSKPGIPITSADKTAQEVTLQFVVNY